MKKVAVILSGCGHLDGAEIRESVLTLLFLDQHKAKVSLFAPDKEQMHVVNHLTGEVTAERRNILVESARIARGEIADVALLDEKSFDALVFPGGYGVAKNLCDLATKGADCQVLPVVKEKILSFLKAKKPIGVICIAPAMVTAALQGQCSPQVTVGEDQEGLIASLGGEHLVRPSTDIAVDETHRIVSCSAYMRNDPLADIAVGIEKLVGKLLQMA